VQPVHFVWWGPCSLSAIATPNALAGSLKGVDLRFWCVDKYFAAFRLALRPEIKVLTYNALIRGPLLPGGSLQAEAHDALLCLHRFQAFSACKDLLSLILLWRFGGYYLDTSVEVAPPAVCAAYSVKGGVTPRRLQDALKKKNSHPRFPRITEAKGRLFTAPIIEHQPFLESSQALTTGLDTSAETQDLILKLPQLDVWAMYSPAGHTALEIAIKSYVSRCNRLGLNRSDSPLNFNRVKGSDILAMLPVQNGTAVSAKRRKDYRNELIGNLVCRSVYDGLVVSYGEDPAQIQKYTWLALEYDDGTAPPPGEEKPKQDIVPELGIIKRYMGSWRVK
jgi:hypothetical protein